VFEKLFSLTVTSWRVDVLARLQTAVDATAEVSDTARCADEDGCLRVDGVQITAIDRMIAGVEVVSVARGVPVAGLPTVGGRRHV